jgi:hypothetical protein
MAEMRRGLRIIRRRRPEKESDGIDEMTKRCVDSWRADENQNRPAVEDDNQPKDR